MRCGENKNRNGLARVVLVFSDEPWVRMPFSVDLSLEESHKHIVYW